VRNGLPEKFGLGHIFYVVRASIDIIMYSHSASNGWSRSCSFFTSLFAREMLRELVLYLPVLFFGGVGCYYYYYYYRRYQVKQAQNGETLDHEDDDEQLIDEIYQQFAEEDGLMEDQEIPFDEEMEFEQEEFDFADEDELQELDRDQINPSPAQLAAATAGAAGSSGSSSRRNRTVGAKKTKSLARKDRIRAYNEYIRQQSEAMRMEQREFEEEFGDIIAEQRKRRAERETSAGIMIKERQIRKKEQQEKIKQQRAEIRAKLVKTLQSSGRVKLRSDLERTLAQDIKDAFIVSDGQWLITMDDNAYAGLAAAVAESGRISFSELAQRL
jgi:hypothetical protein